MTSKIVIYMGRRLSGSSLKHFYTSSEEGSPVFTYKRVLVPAAKIGALIQVTDHPNGGVYIGGEHSPSIVGYYDDIVSVRDWEVSSKIDVLLYTKRRREKEMNRDQKSQIDKAMGVLKSALWDKNRNERAAFVAWVIEELY